MWDLAFHSKKPRKPQKTKALSDYGEAARLRKPQKTKTIKDPHVGPSIPLEETKKTKKKQSLIRLWGVYGAM